MVTPWRRIFALFSVLVLAPAPTYGAQPAVECVIVVSCDGLRPDALEALGEKGAPNFHRLMENSAWTPNARTDFDYTVTLPNHTSVITGRPVVGEQGHNWTENMTIKLGDLIQRNKGEYVAGMFDVAHDNGLRTGIFASKSKFKIFDMSYNERMGAEDETGRDNGKDKIDTFIVEEETGMLMKEFFKASKKDPFGLVMIHLRDTDTSGHKSGWDLEKGSNYLKAVKKIDGLIGDLIEFIDADLGLRGKTAVIITADHGGRLETKTHLNAKELLNYKIPFFVWGAPVATGADLYELNDDSRSDPGEGRPDYLDPETQPIRNGDAANLALSLLGLSAVPGSVINSGQDLKVSP